MQLPTVPENATVADINRYLVSLNTFLQNVFLTGTQMDFSNEDELSEMTSLAQIGKIFYNADEPDTAKRFVGLVNNSGALQKVIFTTTTS